MKVSRQVGKADKAGTPRSPLPRHPLGDDTLLIATVVAASATAAVKLASRPPSCLEPSPLGEAWGQRGRDGGRGRKAKEPRSRYGVAKVCGLRARRYRWLRWQAPRRYRSCMCAALSLMCQHELTHFAVITSNVRGHQMEGSGIAAGEEVEEETGR